MSFFLIFLFYIFILHLSLFVYLFFIYFFLYSLFYFLNMFANGLDAIIIKFIKITNFVFRTVKVLRDCDNKNLLYLKMRLKKTIVYLNKIYLYHRYLCQCLDCKFYQIYIRCNKSTKA